MDAREVSDRLQLRVLVDEYAGAIDTRDGDRFMRVWADDAYFGIFVPDAEEAHAEYHGTAQLATIMELLDVYGPTMHLMANHYVDIDGDEATGTVYALARHVVEREGATHNLEMTVRYHDRYTRTSHGWRIAHRRIVRHWNELIPVLDEQLVF